MGEEQQTKRVNLDVKTYFEGRNYGPGEDVEVPLSFPDADSASAQPSQPPPERVFRKPSSSPPNTGGVDTGEGRAREAVPGGIELPPISEVEVSGVAPIKPGSFET